MKLKHMGVSLLGILGLSGCIIPDIKVKNFDNADKAGATVLQTVHIKSSKEKFFATYLLLYPEEGLSYEDEEFQNIIDSINGGVATPKKPYHGLAVNFTVKKITPTGEMLIKSVNLITDGGRTSNELSIGGIDAVSGDYIFTVTTLKDDERLKHIRMYMTTHRP